MYPDNQAGSSKVSLVIFGLILAVIVYAIVKIAPVYITEYQIQGMFQANADRAETTPLRDIKADVAAKLQIMHAPITMDDVSIVQNDEKDLTISATYSVTVKFVDDLKTTFHFSPEATTEK